MTNQQNPNINTATTFVDSLAHAGLKAVCISPGSRSTPLTLAFAAHPQIHMYPHIDERCASFFALGLALATDCPVALVCTSGTAAANFYPAIIEAHMSQIPLLILTSDRPPELRHSGANQTIDQVKMYGDQVLWAVDMGLPQLSAPAVAQHNVAAIAARAFATANGIRKGAVHINFPFRKPLQPADPQTAIAPASSQQRKIEHKIGRGALLPTATQLKTVAHLINQHPRGLIVCGPRCPDGNFAATVTQLAEQSGYPLLADPLSGVRFAALEEKNLICGYETFLAGGGNHDGELFACPDVVIRFGAVPTSKWLNEYLLAVPIAKRVHIRESGVWADDSHLTTQFIQANEVATCTALAEQLAQRMDLTWASEVNTVEQAFRSALDRALADLPQDESFDVAYMVDLVNALPSSTRLFMGNSLPIRHLDQFGMPTGNALSIYGNRGASGIDGTVSSALGVSAASTAPLVLAIGDVTFAHDLNGLLCLPRKVPYHVSKSRDGTKFFGGAKGAKGVDAPVTIVLFNNGGGNIFRRLPIVKFEPPFTELFLTPHQLDFSSLVQGYGWHYERAENRADFLQKLESHLYSETPTVIEVQTDGEADEVARRELLKKLTG